MQKYHICVLSNLDPHNWGKSDCFDPVLSAVELRFLINLAVKHKCVPKTGDVSQAFCQAYLPENEKHILTPPAGDILTPPNTYLLLKKTLYILKRSPRHWYEMAIKTLRAIGITQLACSSLHLSYHYNLRVATKSPWTLR